MQNNMNNQQNQEKALDRFARNLVEDAKNGKLDPVIGRDEEIRRVLHVCHLGSSFFLIKITVLGAKKVNFCVLN